MTRPDPSSEPTDADVETLAKALSAHRHYPGLIAAWVCSCGKQESDDEPMARDHVARALLADPTLTPVFARAARPTGDPR